MCRTPCIDSIDQERSFDWEMGVQLTQDSMTLKSKALTNLAPALL